MKLFLLHTVLLTKLPLKYRAQSVNSTLFHEFSKTQDSKVYPFHEVSGFIIRRATNALKRTPRTTPSKTGIYIFI